MLVVWGKIMIIYKERRNYKGEKGKFSLGKKYYFLKKGLEAKIQLYRTHIYFYISKKR